MTPGTPATLGDEPWTLVITPERRRFDLGIDQLWHYRDLVRLFVRRDFVATYKQTILGPAWYFAQPLLTSLMFTLIFGKVAGLSTDGLPQILFYMLGTIIWSYFSSCLTQTANTFVTHAGLFGKVYFPRMVVPVATVLSNLIMLAIQLTMFLAFAVYFLWRGVALHPNAWLLATPLLLAEMASLGLGLGVMISSMTTRYRDLQHVVTFGAPLMMYAAPVIYPLSSVPETYRWIVLANPMTPIIETFRYAVLGAGSVSAMHLLYSGVVTAIVLALGVASFNRVERTFMDTV